MAKISPPNTKYDWYQTESHVVINILIKKVKPENARIDIEDSTKLSCIAKVADDTDFSFILNLAHEVEGNNIHWKILPSKIEIKLKKVEYMMWKQLEKVQSEIQPKTDEVIKTYPSSKTKKDWDQIVAEVEKEEDEKPEGEAALNQLFQKIYAEGSDETRKAMNKSFMESGGTVLSTNWNDIATKKVEVNPPEGMEYKKWD
ncbi:protein SGT1 homolog [Caerostris darwini]|uniref:Protein SGT1 homolog n=1 Tax=Caerostris darwini TaxID=1538125 RepID=A0AAV4UU00_9ARAC|nr:protein SGT1 homolog [Caerostris darwini]